MKYNHITGAYVPSSINPLLGIVDNPAPSPEIVNNFKSGHFKRGQVVFYEGDMIYRSYYIHQGKVKIYKMGSDGKEQIIRIALPGDFIGYKDLMAGDTYTASAGVIEETVLYFIPKEDFLDMLKNNNAFINKFSLLLCKDLIEAEKKLVDIAYKPVRGRLADALLSLIKSDEEKNKVSSNILMSREDIASLIGTATETVIRLLSEFKKESLISSKGRLISVLNPGGLKRISLLYN